MSTMSDRDVIAWARDWAETLESFGRKPTAEKYRATAEKYRRLADLAEKGAEGWLPIASAPLDGSEVLFVAHGEVYQGRWDKREKMWRSARGLLFGIATHWRPLPAPPGGER